MIMKDPISLFKAFIGCLPITGARIGAVFVVIMTVLITFEVISRKLFNFSTLLADEAAGYLLVGIVFLGMAYCLSTRGHIFVEFVFDRVPFKLRNWLRLVSYIIAIAYVSLVIYTSTKLAADSYRLSAKSYGMLQVPLVLFQILVPIGMFLFAVQLVVGTLQTVRSFRKRDNHGPGS